MISTKHAEIAASFAASAIAWYVGANLGYFNTIRDWADGIRSKVSLRGQAETLDDIEADDNTEMSPDFLQAAAPRHGRGPYHALSADNS